jgi:hypothetical protein
MGPRRRQASAGFESPSPRPIGPWPPWSSDTATIPQARKRFGVAADITRRMDPHLHIAHGVDLGDYPIDPDALDWEEQAACALVEEHEQVRIALAGVLGLVHTASPSLLAPETRRPGKRSGVAWANTRSPGRSPH